MEPVVSIVVPAYNALPTLRETLEGCLGQDYPPDKLEVIVVDDGSSDATASLASRYPVKYIYQSNRGPAAARNAGWKAAKGEIICFTDSDCVPEKKWVKKLAAGFIHEQIGGVGGSYDIRNPDSPLARLIHKEISARHRTIPRETHFLGSFNVSYRYRVLEEVGGFDETFRWASGEDNDLSYRILRAGYKLIFIPDAKVSHLHTEGMKEYLREQYRHGYWRVKLYTMHPEMMGGDDYSGFCDFLPPALVPLIVTLIVVGIFWKVGLYMAVGTAALILALGAYVVLSLPWEGDGAGRWLMVWVLFLRSFARGLGLIKGTVEFVIKPRLARVRKLSSQAFSP